MHTAAEKGNVSSRLVGKSGDSDVRTIATRLHQSFGPNNPRAMNPASNSTAAVRSWLRATCPPWRASRRRRVVGGSVFSSRSAGISSPN